MGRAAAPASLDERNRMSTLNRRSLFQMAGGFAGALSLPGLSMALQSTTSPYRRPKLKITDVRTAYINAHGPQLHIRIYTDQGLIGQGESTDAAIGGAAIVASWRRSAAWKSLSGT
jgi:hypothetical protein